MFKVKQFFIAVLPLVVLSANALAATITVNIANAPAWQALHSYTHTGRLGDRVSAGPALTPGGSPTYASGSALYLLELTTAGTSSGSQPTISSCPSTGISDGGAVWKCLTVVDYPDITQATDDTPEVWQANAAPCTSADSPGCYNQLQVVKNAGYVWRMCAWEYANCTGSTVPTAPTYKCTSAPSGPGPTNPAIINLDGPGTVTPACAWQAIAFIAYTSQRIVPWPHQRGGANGYGAGYIPNTNGYDHVVWHGGIAAQTYPPQSVTMHQQIVGAEQTPLCPDGVTAWFANWDCGGGPHPLIPVQFRAAPGDSIHDDPTGPLIYDPSRGVAIEATGTSALEMGELWTWWTGIQIKNSGTTVSAMHDPSIRASATQFNNMIIDTTGDSISFLDNANVYINNLLISRSTTPGSMGIGSDYWDYFLNNTIVNTQPGVANKTAMFRYKLNYNDPPWDTPASTMSIFDNIFIGWANDLAIQDLGGGPPPTGLRTQNNVTTSPNSNAGTPFTPAGWSNPVTPYKLDPSNNGTNIFSQTAVAIFVSPGSDYKLLSTSPARGAGAANSFSGISYPIDNALDFFGVTRAPTYDVGPAQFGASVLPFSGPGRRGLMR